ncbi:uncharacterized protein LOC141648813 [Silene latifolia]|uniref:uncharacterized protein LOC141648813 n=1 Tax=Silene latifolia TaxID=37657 RepID=UPI003D789549
MKQIATACRNFLWTGVANDVGKPLVSWEQICKDKCYAGLGIKDLIRWNKAALGKYVWWLAQKKDHLWDNQDYTIRKGYNWLGPTSKKVVWSKFVWVKEAIPKHSFIGWLVAQNRLLTRDRLKKMGIIEDETCPLCGTLPESHHHLFFSCIFSQKCLQLMSAKLGCHLPSHDFIEWWTSRRFSIPVQKNKIAATYLALIYAIWWNRNMGRLEGRVQQPTVMIRGIVEDLSIGLD